MKTYFERVINAPEGADTFLVREYDDGKIKVALPENFEASLDGGFTDPDGGWYETVDDIPDSWFTDQFHVCRSCRCALTVELHGRCDACFRETYPDAWTFQAMMRRHNPRLFAERRAEMRGEI